MVLDMGIVIISVFVSFLDYPVGMIQIVLISILIRAEIPLGELVDVEPVVTSEQVLDYLVVFCPVPAERIEPKFLVT